MKDLYTILAEQRTTYLKSPIPFHYFTYNGLGHLGPSCDKNLQGTMTHRPRNFLKMSPGQTRNYKTVP